MEIKTSELTGAALDWVVAKCDSRKIGFNPGGGLEVRGRTEDGDELPEQWDLWMPWHPSTDWSQGGPIIEREGVSMRFSAADARGAWYAVLGANRFLSPDFEGSGPTPLIASMRCYVASKLGDEVDIPDDLTP